MYTYILRSRDTLYVTFRSISRSIEEMAVSERASTKNERTRKSGSLRRRRDGPDTYVVGEQFPALNNFTERPAPTSFGVLPPRGLSVMDASKYAGTTVWFIRMAIWEKRLPALRLGKKNVILRDDIDRFLDIERQKQLHPNAES